MRLKIPGVPPSINAFIGRQNVWEYRAAKKKWTEAVQWAVKAARWKDEPLQHARVVVTYHFARGGRHDPDNYAGKFLLDGLTRAGVIIDDDMEHIVLEIRGDKGGNAWTEIEVIDDADR